MDDYHFNYITKLEEKEKKRTLWDTTTMKIEKWREIIMSFEGKKNR
jgi:hypothetical protein